MKKSFYLLILICSLSLCACNKDGLILSEVSEPYSLEQTESGTNQTEDGSSGSFDASEGTAGSSDESKDNNGSSDESEGAAGSSDESEGTAGSSDASMETAGYVHVCGAVKNPGIYEFTDGSRVFELIEKAGGFDEDADTESYNLALEVKDGQQIRIPYIGEEIVAEEGLINLNKASVEELCAIPGIGESRAQAIIAYRDKNGGFKDVEELKEISGIKDATFEKIKPYVCVY